MKQQFTLCILTGIIMLGAACIFLMLPNSSVVGKGLLITFAILFAMFGSILIYFQTVGHLRFFLLTMPFLVVASIYASYGLLVNDAALVPAYFLLAFDITLQYCHARQEEFRRWMNL